MRWRYGLHVLDGLGEVALVRREPEQALLLAEEELAGARRHRAQKLEARALALRGRALLALDRRPEAQATLREAIALGERIGYPAVRWRALGVLAEADRRDARGEDAAAHAAAARRIVDGLARTLPDPDLERAFREAVSGSRPA
jgi:hypothetical protein